MDGKPGGVQFFLLLVVLVAACILVACGGGQPRGAGDGKPPRAPRQDRSFGSSPQAPQGALNREAQGPGGPRIGFSIATDTFIIERWNKDMNVFNGAARELGAEVIVQLSAGGTREQIAQINYMVNQNIDILVVVAHDTEQIGPAVKQVREAGIPVIAYDRFIQGVPIDAYISFDSREVGRSLGRALEGAVPRGTYLMVNGALNDTNSYELNAGFHEIMDSHIEAGEIRLEREIWLDEWSFDEALEKIGAILEETTDIDAIACGNDQIAGAAIQRLSERRLAGKAAVVGQDAELISCQHIVEGLQLMTVYKPIGSLAARAARLALSIAAGEEVPPDALLDNRSSVPIPSYIEKSIPVYKHNMDVVIKDGFHSFEDIYRNLGL